VRPELGPLASAPRVPDAAHAGAGPPALVFDTTYDAGRLDAGEPLRAEFPWRHEGAGVLRGVRAETGCGCAVASGLPSSIAPGERGVLVLDVAGRSRPGPFSLDVLVVGEGPAAEPVRLRVRGFVGSLVVVEPSSIDVDRVLVGAETTRFVVVRPPPGRETGEVLATVHGLAGSCDVGRPIRLGARGRDVRVTLHAPPRAGPFHAHVEVRVQGEGVWRLPIRGEAVPAIGAAVGPAEARAPPAAGAR
jgi:hypothetical protein